MMRTAAGDTSSHAHLELGLVDKGDEPAVHVGEGGTEGRVQDLLVQLQQSRGQGDVGQGDLLANEEGAGLEDHVQDTKDALDVLLSASSGLVGSVARPSGKEATNRRVVLDDAEGGVDPGARCGVHLVLRQADVLLHQGRLVRTLGGEGIAGSSNVLGDGAGLVESLSISTHERRHLAEGKLLEELGRLVGHSELEVGLLRGIRMGLQSDWVFAPSS